MIYRTLGRTGLSVSAIALGCEGFVGMTPDELRAEIDRAEELGINFIDLYSSNPELRSALGHALAGRHGKFVVQGHLCSVWENGQYLRTRDLRKSEAAFEDLLARLGTDRIDIGILASLDPVALDQACVDLVYASEDPGKVHLIERMESRHGIHTVEHAEALGVGSRTYELVDLDEQ